MKGKMYRITYFSFYFDCFMHLKIDPCPAAEYSFNFSYIFFRKTSKLKSYLQNIAYNFKYGYEYAHNSTLIPCKQVTYYS